MLLLELVTTDTTYTIVGIIVLVIFVLHWLDLTNYIIIIPLSFTQQPGRRVFDRPRQLGSCQSYLLQSYSALDLEYLRFISLILSFPYFLRAIGLAQQQNTL